MNATQQLITRMKQYDTLLCVGLDPDISRFPTAITDTMYSPERQVIDFLEGVVKATHQHVCAYKVQKAFFDLLSGGHEVLKHVINYIHTRHPGIPVIVDCKIGDIDNTMGAYAHNLFDLLQADGVVVNPYMGDDVMTPFMKRPDKAIVVLIKTSNPGGAIVQDVRLANGKHLWEHVLDQVISRWNSAGNMIPVLSSTAGLPLASIRQRIPNNMPILLAGVGAQGGSYRDLTPLLNDQGIGVFVNSSRGILYPPQQADTNWQRAIEEEAIRLRTALNNSRGD